MAWQGTERKKVLNERESIHLSFGKVQPCGHVLSVHGKGIKY